MLCERRELHRWPHNGPIMLCNQLICFIISPTQTGLLWSPFQKCKIRKHSVIHIICIVYWSLFCLTNYQAMQSSPNVCVQRGRKRLFLPGNQWHTKQGIFNTSTAFEILITASISSTATALIIYTHSDSLRSTSAQMLVKQWQPRC